MTDEKTKDQEIEPEPETENETEAENETETETETEAAAPSVTFEDLKLNPELLQAIEDMGFEAPSDVQAAAIPIALEGKDLLVQSRTGSGKTAAFGIPMVQQLIDTSRDETQALVLSPTRELANQVCKEIERLSAHSPMKVVPVYGGAAMDPQTRALKAGVHLVVGTPGRVLDNIRRKNFKTDAVKLLVLDEGDEMLSMGFLEEISKILDAMPEERQTFLFSATVPDEIKKIADRYMKEPESIMLSEDFIGVREITHLYYLVSGGNRLDDLIQVLEYEQPTLALIFCNTRDDTANVALQLKRKGYNAKGISSDLSQNERERAMDQMRKGELQFMVATDVAARGIDLPELSHVINYAFPESADVYVHRTGRTGRAGKHGRAVSLIAPRELGSFYYLKLIHKIFPEERHLPSGDEIKARSEAARMQKLLDLFESREPSEELRNLAKRLWTTLDGERLMALTLGAALGEFDQIQAVLKEMPIPEARAAQPSPPRSDDDREPRRDSYRDRDRGNDRRGGRDRDRGRSRSGGRDRDRGRSRSGGRDRDRDGRGGPRRDRDRDRGRGSSERKTTRSHRGSFDMPDGEKEQFDLIDRDSQESRGPRVVPDDQVRLYFNTGHRQGADRSDLSQFICDEAGVTSGDIHQVDIQHTFSFVNVSADAGPKVLEGLNGKEYQDFILKVEKAKAR